MHILLIEPDRILGAGLQEALEAFGCSVAWSRSAQAALDALDDTLPDIIILELQLGLHNGIEFLYEIRSYTEWQQIPVIAHTINSKAQDPIFNRSFKSLGVQAVLYKPRTSTSQLIRVVRQFLPVA